jgi:hypothetical protein
VCNLLSSLRPFHQGIPDFKPDSFEFTSHLMIPKAQRLDSLRGEKAFAFFIVLLLCRESMSTAVQFHREFCFDAKEIQVVDPARILPPELKIVEASVAQETPETLLCIGGFFAEPAGKFTGGCSPGAPGTPHPSPLPSEGRGNSRL